MENITLTPRLVKLPLLAQAVDLSERKLVDLATSGQIPSHKIGHNRLFDIEEVLVALKQLAKRESAAPPEPLNR